ncbi:MAG: right-handed parallel beta-helix repeat-containing protein [Bacteroidales bacterium]|nr:right-handed parallel beta-helix repeat-containing protein [Bacteroidales bacterium]
MKRILLHFLTFAALAVMMAAFTSCMGRGGNKTENLTNETVKIEIAEVFNDPHFDMYGTWIGTASTYIGSFELPEIEIYLDNTVSESSYSIYFGGRVTGTDSLQIRIHIDSGGGDGVEYINPHDKMITYDPATKLLYQGDRSYRKKTEREFPYEVIFYDDNYNFGVSALLTVFWSPNGNNKLFPHIIDSLHFAYEDKLHSLVLGMPSKIFDSDGEPNTGLLLVDDYNYDGHYDIAVLSNRGVSKPVYDYYLYNPRTQSYQRSKTLTGQMQEKSDEYDEAALKALIAKHSTAGVEVIAVNSADAFVNAIGSDRVIILKGAPIHLEDLFTTEFEIFGVNNLKIIGLGDTPVNIFTLDDYGNVIVFKDCSNITIENIDAGHWPDKGSCSGGVFRITDSKNFTINNTIMFGSGTEGIMAENVTNLICNNSIIRGCTYSIMTISTCSDFEFNDCDFINNKGWDLVNIWYSSNVTFKNCTFSNNRKRYDDTDTALFNVESSTSVTLNDCIIKNNKTDILSKNANTIVLKNTKLENNAF